MGASPVTEARFEEILLFFLANIILDYAGGPAEENARQLVNRYVVSSQHRPQA